jgi:predicted unusual protein kinase regulating ubiquinone biosynthesis (AarF/ABC1/UbiB family)
LELVKISKDFNLPINTQLMLLQKNMFYLEGMAKNLGFTGNFWGLSKTVMRDWGKQNLSIKAKLKERIQEFSNNLNSINETIYYAKKYYKSGADGKKSVVVIKQKSLYFFTVFLLITNLILLTYVFSYKLKIF